MSKIAFGAASLGQPLRLPDRGHKGRRPYSALFSRLQGERVGRGAVRGAGGRPTRPLGALAGRQDGNHLPFHRDLDVPMHYGLRVVFLFIYFPRWYNARHDSRVEAPDFPDHVLYSHLARGQLKHVGILGVLKVRINFSE